MGRLLSSLRSSSIARFPLVARSAENVEQLVDPKERVNRDPRADDIGGSEAINNAEPDQAADAGRYLPDARCDMLAGAVDDQAPETRHTDDDHGDPHEGLNRGRRQAGESEQVQEPRPGWTEEQT